MDDRRSGQILPGRDLADIAVMVFTLWRTLVMLTDAPGTFPRRRLINSNAVSHAVLWYVLYVLANVVKRCKERIWLELPEQGTYALACIESQTKACEECNIVECRRTHTHI